MSYKNVYNWMCIIQKVFKNEKTVKEKNEKGLYEKIS